MRVIVVTSTMTKLSVNLNKIALLRNQRDYGVPSVLKAAMTCIEAGVHGITVHPRPDQRHITKQDVYELAEVLKQHEHIEYNIEGNPFEGDFMNLVNEVRPTQATLVPDDPRQRTSDRGWNMRKDADRLKPIIGQLGDSRIRVSLFMDPDTHQLSLVPDTGAERIELYTESYATAFRAGDYASVLNRYVEAGARAGELGLAVNAGHDLNLKNLRPFCQAVPGVLEVSIGHALTGDAIWMGLCQTVEAYLEALSPS